VTFVIKEAKYLANIYFLFENTAPIGFSCRCWVFSSSENHTL